MTCCGPWGSCADEGCLLLAVTSIRIKITYTLLFFWAKPRYLRGFTQQLTIRYPTPSPQRLFLFARSTCPLSLPHAWERFFWKSIAYLTLCSVLLESWICPYFFRLACASAQHYTHIHPPSRRAAVPRGSRYVLVHTAQFELPPMVCACSVLGMLGSIGKA